MDGREKNSRISDARSRVNPASRQTRQSLLHGVGFQYYLWAFLLVLIITMIARLLATFLDPVNIVLLYLVPVLVSAVRWGRGPSILASLLGVLTFDFFFVPPVFSFTVNDVRYLFGFAVFIVVALVTGTMATRLRNELEKATQRETRTLALYTLSREIAAQPDLQQVLQTLVTAVAETIDARAILFMHDPETGTVREAVAAPPDFTLPGEKERAVAHWVLEHGQEAGIGTETVSGSCAFFYPVKTEAKILAVLAIQPHSEDTAFTSEQLQLLEAFANLAAVAIVRVRLAKEAEQARWLTESEKLRTALLNSISHDLRTPLASITGAATSLLEEKADYSKEAKEVLLNTIKEEARRMNRFVGNLLDMVQLESGILKLNREWCDIEDIAGVALRELRDTLSDHPLQVAIPPDLPLLKADFILMEQVMINLLENAIRHSPPDAVISVSAHQQSNNLLVVISDSGPAIPTIEREHIFDKFYRIHPSKHGSGTGLGLSICKGIVEAHGGQIWVDSLSGVGNHFTFSLPIPKQPESQSDTNQGNAHVV